VKALFFNDFGASDVLQYGDVDQPVPAVGEVLVKTDYIGVNFADIYRRRGTYHIEQRQPYINGYEGSGQIVEAGTGVSPDEIGRLVLFVDVPFANAEYVVAPQDKLIYLPDDIDVETAATVGLQGMTADFLAHDLGMNQPGDHVFITGISGGVGQILSQMLIADHVQVSGSASTQSKREAARIWGVSQVYPSDEPGWQSSLAGQFDTVYDGVGSTLNQSISLLKTRGKIVFFGMAGGHPPAIDLVEMLSHSQSIVTGDLWDYRLFP